MIVEEIRIDEELSLLPRDHDGRDLKASGIVLGLPKRPRLRVRWLDARGQERCQDMSYSWARHVLRRDGYRLQDGRERWRG